MKISCYTDIHNMLCMLNIPTVLRKSAIDAAELTLAEWGKSDLSIIGGDNVSDYPHWNKSCALPYANWLDIKEKLVKNFARTAKNERVLYVSGNNDLILGDLPTKENPPYNTCDFYHTGPMNKTLGILNENDFYGKYAASKGMQAGIYHLAFHYLIDGINFFGLNIDPDEAFNNHDCCYDVDSIKWLKNKLNDVDPNGNKLIFVVGHVSATVRKTDGSIINNDMDSRRRNALIDAFKGHKNLFYLYGHIHGQDYMRSNSFEGVFHFDNDGNLFDTPNGILTEKQAKTIGFHTVHMGGLRPFTGNERFKYFENDGMTGTVPGDTEPKFYEATGTCKIGQYLLIETHSDRVEFMYRNIGTTKGFTPLDKPEKYIVKL